jgi:hypothetical protein
MANGSTAFWPTTNCTLGGSPGLNKSGPTMAARAARAPAACGDAAAAVGLDWALTRRGKGALCIGEVGDAADAAAGEGRRGVGLAGTEDGDEDMEEDPLADTGDDGTRAKRVGDTGIPADDKVRRIDVSVSLYPVICSRTETL